MRVRYWFLEGIRLAAIFVLTCPLYGVMMALMSSTLDGEMSPIRFGFLLGAGFMSLFSTFMAMVLQSNMYRMYAPVSLGFGATRREVRAGMQCMRLCLLLPSVVGGVILGLGAQSLLDGRIWAILPLGVGLYLFYTAAGALCSILTIKLSVRTAALLNCGIMMLLFVVPLAIALACLVSLGDGIDAALLALLARVWPIVFSVLAVGIIAYGLVLIPERKIVQNFTVEL